MKTHPQSTTWLVTWDIKEDIEWKEYIVSGYTRNGKSVADMKVKSLKEDEVVYVKRVIASHEVAPSKKLNHVHIIVEFSKSVSRAQVKTCYNNNAYAQVMSAKFDNVSRTINYILKDKPASDDLFIWPSLEHWNEFPQLAQLSVDK